MIEMDKNRLGLAILTAIVIASGCAGGGTSNEAASSDSVSVMNFSAFPSSPYDNQQTRITLELKNEGEVDAENTAARLFNVPFSGNKNWNLDGSKTKEFGTLEAADPENDLPARPHRENWRLEAPNIQDGLTVPYKFMTRIFYKYRTNANTEITLMSQDRFREQGKTGRPSLENSDGPIQMEIRTETPIVFYPEEDGSTRQSEMCVIVRNEGDGTPFYFEKGETYKPGSDRRYSVSDEDTDRVQLSIEDAGNIQFKSESGGDTDTVELIGSKGISCWTIEANFGAQSEIQREVPVTMEADYGYYKEDQVSVTVRGSERFGN